MAEDGSILSYACPRCDRALDAVGDRLRCAGCRVDFPRVAGIPWLFAEPGAALDEWRARFGFALRRAEQEAARLEAASGAPTLREQTKARLAASRAALVDHAARLRTLLAPLGEAIATAKPETYLALRTRLPPDQGLTTYYHNVHRDWAWGERENEAALAAVAAALGDRPAGRTLVLGAGAGRLAYDFHERCGPSVTAALDFNPLLVLVAARAARGEAVELYEFPLAPRSTAEHAVLRRLAAPAPARAGLEFVLADAHRPPFAAGAFDTIVTPWLIDILPEPFDALAARINALLADGGRWLNFGSLAFHDADPALRYGLDECVAALEEHGFGTPEVTEQEVPYMASPASRHARLERTVTWIAEKRRAAKRPARYQALPEWLVRGTEPVPLTDSFRTQAATTRIHAFIMSLIDGRRSLKDIAAVLAEQRLVAPEEGEGLIRGFLIKMYDDSRRGIGY